MNRLELSIEGEPGQITLVSFVGVMARATRILEDLDSAISERPKGALDWYIEDLSIGSAVAVIESRTTRPDVDADRLGRMVGANFIGGLDVIERKGEMPPYFSEQDLGHVRAISSFLRRTGSHGLKATQFNGDAADLVRTTLSQNAASNVAKILKPHFKAIGSVTGKLEVISVHREPKFNVYDVVTKKAVSCRFDRGRLDEVKAALGRRVSVTGIVYRNANGDPIKVERPELRVLPTTTPGVRDLIGLVPDMSGEDSAEEYIRKLRNG